MIRDARLEQYLTSLERALKPFPVSDRADIITEIKSHVQSTLERNPQASLDSLLSALGAPETVANRYLLERGLTTTKPPISPVVKWLVIGFLGTLAMLLIFAGFLVTYFTPILNVDRKKDVVSVMDGIVEINGKSKTIKINGKEFTDSITIQTDGSSLSTGSQDDPESQPENPDSQDVSP